MEQYMSKTRADYGSGVARPKIEDKDNFELKDQFLKELRTNIFSGLDHEDANKHIEKVLKIVDLFHIPKITIDQVMLRSFSMSLTGTEVILFYNGLGIPTRKILDSSCAIPTKTAADAKLDANNENDPITPKIAHSKKKGKLSKKLTTRNLVDLFKEGDIEQQLRDSIKGTMLILPSTDAAIRNQGASIKTLEIQIGQMSKVLQEKGFRSLPSSTESNPRDQVKSISTTIESDSYPIRHIGSSQYAVSIGQNQGIIWTTILEAYSEASHIINSIPRKEKDPGSFTLPCFINNVCFDNALVDLGASVSVMPLSTYLSLGLGELAHTNLTVELADMTVKYPKGIAKNVLVDYIELNDLNEPFELKRNQGDDLMPTIKEGEVIGEFRTRDDELDTGIDDLPNLYDYDKKIHIDFLEDMDAYRDKRMGDIIFGEPFLREVGIKARQFEGMITIYNGNDEVTYQMVHHIRGVSIYKGVLNLGRDHIRDARTEEWLIRGQINVHEMEW
ncbi:hypothetical protein Tco_1029315 [Tanacetum coccineum]|uniref:Reverse transcriptase domain-containing protein n=1 Tax=Tanacetum coccineum TaxID=301880 RepID=A0ABQ5G337_9ASTR